MEHMPTPVPDRLHQASPWPGKPQSPGQRAARRAGVTLLCSLCVIIFALGTVPPLLDWGRFRIAIAAIAGAELGRPVVIAGDVSLRLLPDAVLTASDVTVPDRGDGMSSQVASLRLEVALFPLLLGHIVPRDLVLGSPVLILPWPLPGGIVNSVRPRVPHPFAAHVENGRVRIGQTEITGITAAIHGSPTMSLAPDALPAAAFAADGFAAFDGQDWRFTTALGAPDADGVSAVDLAMQGQGKAKGTGGAIQGTLAEGVVQGRLIASGPDLSLLMPASAEAWHAEAPFIASGEQITSPAISLSLAGAPATATLALRLAAPSQLDAHMSASALDLDGWAHLLGPRLADFAMPAIPMRFYLSAGKARLLGGALAALNAVLVFDAGHADVRDVHANLPGNASLSLAGAITRRPGGLLMVEGPATLDAPDLHATLAWLRPLAPALVDALPGKALRQAHLQGTIDFVPGHLSARSLAGSLDGSSMTGRFDLDLGTKPRFAADASLDRLDIDDWLDGTDLHPGMKLADFARAFASPETALHLRAKQARWAGHDLTDIDLDASTGAAGLHIAHAQAASAGLTLSASGAIAQGGKVTSMRLRATSHDGTRTLGDLPAAWRWAPGLWKGQADIEVTADGAPDALSLQMRADAGDLVLEAETKRDTLAGTGTATLTLRHPGAPRLLAALGLPGADAWLDNGSLALLAHLRTGTDRVIVQDFSLDAASLRMEGSGDLDLSGANPAMSLDVRADSLALPAPAMVPAASWQGFLPKTWTGHVRLAAKDVTLGLRDAASGMEATLDFAAGAAFLHDMTANLSGGRLTAQAALDTEQAQPVAAFSANLSGARLSAPLTSWPIDAASGTLDLAVDLLATGAGAAAWPASMSGEVRAMLHDVTLTGFDLTRLTSLLGPHARRSRAALQAALSQGSSADLSGAVSASVDHGIAQVAGASVTSPEGAVSATGSIDLGAETVDLTFGMMPLGAASPHLSVRLSGPWQDAKATPDAGAPRLPPRKASKSPARHTPPPAIASAPN
jgi:hypothetical protein